MQKYKVIGLMSGTSLDGLDIAYCEFTNKGKQWKYTIREAKTIPYTEARKKTLGSLMKATAEELCHEDAAFGKYIGQQVNLFIRKKQLKPSLIASHGHTIFHQPGRGFTTQIGSGAAIYAETGVPVVCDFRSVDVSRGGQGAPLVPAGDKLLFSEYAFCLNLGGISNISYDQKGRRIAYDISPVNTVLNHLAVEKGMAYDRNGMLASQGKINRQLLEELNALDYYRQPVPKSLGREWIDTNIFPLLDRYELSTEDKLATMSDHIAWQIACAAMNVAGKKKGMSMLVTGGGAFNAYLIARLTAYLQGKVKVVIPDKNIVMFKEALIFAFLGVLRAGNQPNCLKSVSGASSDSIGGCLYGSFSTFS